MNKIVKNFKRFMTCEQGGSTVEYTVLVGTISTGLIVAFQGLSVELENLFKEISRTLSIVTGKLKQTNNSL